MAKEQCPVRQHILFVLVVSLIFMIKIFPLHDFPKRIFWQIYLGHDNKSLLENCGKPYMKDTVYKQFIIFKQKKTTQQWKQLTRLEHGQVEHCTPTILGLSFTETCLKSTSQSMMHQEIHQMEVVTFGSLRSDVNMVLINL